MFGVHDVGGVPYGGVPIIKTISFLGLYWGPPFQGNYDMPRIQT